MYCAICKTHLEEGELRYLLTINVTADFDNTLPKEGDIDDLEAFMNRLEDDAPAVLERDVHQSQGYLLCPTCKRRYMENPLGLEKEEESEGEGRVH